MRFLLDTCVISEVTKPKPSPEVITWLDRQMELSLFLSVITIGELQKGISKLPDSRKQQQLQEWVEQDLTRRFTGRILEIDREIAIRWGSIAGASEQQGIKIPVLDGWLAATAIVHGLTMATRNISDIAPTGVTWFNPWL